MRNNRREIIGLVESESSKVKKMILEEQASLERWATELFEEVERLKGQMEKKQTEMEERLGEISGHIGYG
jgi:septin family protein